MTKHNWSIKEFHSKAWHVVRTYKQLWLLGLAVMVFTGGSSFNMSNSFDSSDLENTGEYQVDAQTKIPDVSEVEEDEETLYRLDDTLKFEEEEAAEMPSEYSEYSEYQPSEEGEAMYDFFEPVGELASKVFEEVQPVAWLMATLSIISFGIIGLMTYVVGSSWSQAALVLGVAEAVEDKDPNISKVSVRALHYVKSVFFVGLLPWLVFVFVFTFFFILGMILSAIISGIFQSWWIMLIMGLVGLIALVIGLIMVSTTVALALREAVLHSTGAQIAIRRSWIIAQKSWSKGFSLFFRNGLIEFLVTLALFLPGIIAAWGPIGQLSENWESIGFNEAFSSFAPAIILMGAAMIAYLFFKSVYNVFTFTTWHLAHSALSTTSPSSRGA